MTNKTFKNRTKGFNKKSNAYRNAFKLLNGTKIVRTCYITGSGRYTKNYDSTIDTINILKALKLIINKDYVLLNDAPKGGKAGQFLKLTTKGKKKIIKVDIIGSFDANGDLI